MVSTSKVLVTGASGQIGRRLVRKLMSQGSDVYTLSTENYFENEPKIKHIKKNRGEPIGEQLPTVDTIFHLSSQTSAYIARESVARDVETNLMESIHIIEKLSRQSQPPAMIYAGSMTAYGMGKEDLINEESALDPLTFYDAGKLANQLYLEQYVREGRLRSCSTLRLANIYGAHERTKIGERGFLDQCIWNAIVGKDLYMYGDGNYLRDYLHIDDAVEAFNCAGEISNDESINVFNIGTGQATSLRSALQQIIDGANTFTGSNSQLISIEFPANSYSIEKRNSVVDASSFSNLTGWSPKVEFKNGLISELAQARTLLDQNSK